ncbi:MAG: PUA domain-containing protein, partial [Nanoarchaeota archaeon]
NQFVGKIKQLPPIVSAVKREERIREIYFIKLLDIKEDNQHVLFRVGCQHGTYIRKLCSDIGSYLECGAQMKELRRTKAGPFREEDNSISLDKLRNLYELYNDSKTNKNKQKEEILEQELRKYIKPYEEALKDFKKVFVRDNAVSNIAHGSDLAIPGIAKLSKDIKIGEEIAMFTQKNELIGMGMAYLNTNDVIKKNKGAFIKTQKIFMEPNYYPKIWDFTKEQKEIVKD